MSEVDNLTFVLRVLEHGAGENPMYAVVNIGPEEAQEILDKRSVFRNARGHSSDELQEMSFSSNMVTWVEHSEVRYLFEDLKCQMGNTSIIDAVENYGKAVTTEMPTDLPLLDKVECETLHLDRYGCKWRVYLEGAGNGVETHTIPYTTLQDIIKGTITGRFHHSIRMELESYIRDWMNWEVNASPDHFGTYWITEIDKATNPDLGGDKDSEEMDRRVIALLQASPKLYVACKDMLDWIDQARNGTLNDMESAMGRKCPDEQMRRACQEAV